MSADDSTGSKPPDQDATQASAAKARLSPVQAMEAWERSKREVVKLLGQTAPDAEWVAAVARTAQSLLALARRDTDMALYLMLERAATDTQHYSTRHAMLCAVVCDLCASWFEWPAEEILSLVKAALTMNLAMTAMQDKLARQEGPLSPAQRQEIDAHAINGALLLTQAGVTDALWIDVVRQHHDAAPQASDVDPPAATRLASLLRRVDIYTAKLSRRASREAATPALAARDVCLDNTGKPDATGAAILRVLGLFPPGIFVLLASGDICIVVRRGAKAHTPVVVPLRRDDGRVPQRMATRDTAAPGYAVVKGISATDVRFRLNNEQVLSAV